MKTILSVSNVFFVVDVKNVIVNFELKFQCFRFFDLFLQKIFEISLNISIKDEVIRLKFLMNR